MADYSGEKEGFDLSQSDHNKAAILGDRSQTTAAAISHPSISFRHTQLITEQKNHLLWDQGLEKLPLISSVFFF